MSDVCLCESSFKLSLSLSVCVPDCTCTWQHTVSICTDVYWWYYHSLIILFVPSSTGHSVQLHQWREVCSGWGELCGTVREGSVYVVHSHACAYTCRQYMHTEHCGEWVNPSTSWSHLSPTVDFPGLHNSRVMCHLSPVTTAELESDIYIIYHLHHPMIIVLSTLKGFRSIHYKLAWLTSCLSSPFLPAITLPACHHTCHYTSFLPLHFLSGITLPAWHHTFWHLSHLLPGVCSPTCHLPFCCSKL